MLFACSMILMTQATVAMDQKKKQPKLTINTKVNYTMEVMRKLKGSPLAEKDENITAIFNEALRTSSPKKEVNGGLFGIERQRKRN